MHATRLMVRVSGGEETIFRKRKKPFSSHLRLSLGGHSGESAVAVFALRRG